MKQAEYSSRNDVIIVGAGLAGGCTAYALAKRGLKVSILESGNELAPKASGNRLALITPYITDKASSRETLYSTGYNFSLQMLEELTHSSDIFHRCGALQFPTSTRLHKILNSTSKVIGVSDVVRVSAHEASTISGIDIKHPAFFARNAGYLEPKTLIKRHLEEYPEGISIHYGTDVKALERDEQVWRITTNTNKTFSARVVVLAGAYETASLPLTSWLPLEAIRGQTETIPTNASLGTLRTALCYGGYLTPSTGDIHMLGALYRHNDRSVEPLASDTEAIFSDAQAMFPSLSLSTHGAIPRVCFRTSTPDRIPYIGRLPNFAEMRKKAAQYRSGTNLKKHLSIEWLEGIYVSVGHGSRGLLSCPLGAEIIARTIVAEELGELSLVSDIVSPARLPKRLIAKALNSGASRHFGQN